LAGNDFLAPARRRGRVAAGVGLAVMAFAVVLATTGLPPWRTTGDATISAPPATSPGERASSGSAPGSAPAPSPDADAGVMDDLPPQGQVTVLPRGTRRVGTFRTGYPMTLRGAVAAAVEYTGQAGCLDVPCVDALTRAALDPAWTAGRGEELAGARKARAMLGIPERQPVPAGAVLTPTPMAYQLAPVPAGAIPAGDRSPRVRVMLLIYAAMAGPAITPRNTLTALPATLHWTGGDWKLTAGDRSYPELVAQPGTPQAAALGWRDFAA
jgi:hypothetical protein